MIPKDAALRFTWLPTREVEVEEIEPGQPEQVVFYHHLLTSRPEEATDPIVVEQLGDRYVIKNGRHRWMAHILAGRTEIAAVVYVRAAAGL